MRWWRISTMLAPRSPSTVVSWPMLPGTSGTSTCSRVSRPWRIRPRMMTEASSRGSTLPPVSTTPTLRPAKRSRCASSAAIPAARGHDLLDLEEEVHRLLAVLLAHGHDVVDQGVDDLAGQRAGPGDGDALGDRRAAAVGLDAGPVGAHRRVALGLDPDQLDAG